MRSAVSPQRPRRCDISEEGAQRPTAAWSRWTDCACQMAGPSVVVVSCRGYRETPPPEAPAAGEAGSAFFDEPPIDEKLAKMNPIERGVVDLIFIGSERQGQNVPRCMHTLRTSAEQRRSRYAIGRGYLYCQSVPWYQISCCVPPHTGSRIARLSKSHTPKKAPRCI